MDTDRFDSLTKTFATRFSRRTAMRGGGVSIAATFLAAVGFRSATGRQADSAPYTIIRHYTLSGSPDAVVQELNSGFLPLVSQADGFLSYSVVTSDNNTLTTIAVFESQAQLESAAQSEADWVQQNLASLLPAPAEVTQGNTVVYGVNSEQICSTPTVVPTESNRPTATTQPAATMTPTPTPITPCTGEGCRCNGGVQGACDSGLTCCADNPGVPGGPGHCIAEDATCNGQNCTGKGCTCHSGTQGACDDGLICCSDDSSQPGGPGRCEAEDVCRENACQATTNPCPSTCSPDSHCDGCCSGYCLSDGHCGSEACTGIGCECHEGMQGSRCDEGLVCCQSQMGGDPTPGAPGMCAAADACGNGGATPVT